MRGYFLVFIVFYYFLCSLYNSGYGHVTNFMTTFASRVCSPGYTTLDFHFMTTYDSFTPHKHVQVLLASFALCASRGPVPSTFQPSYDNLPEYGAHEPRPDVAVAVLIPCALHQQYYLPTSWKETAYMLNENEGAYHTRRTLMRNEMLWLLRAPYLGKTLYYFEVGCPGRVQSVYRVAPGQLCATTRGTGLVFISTDVFDEPAMETLTRIMCGIKSSFSQRVFLVAIVKPCLCAVECGVLAVPIWCNSSGRSLIYCGCPSHTATCPCIDIEAQ
jgi:hypothetical protein